MFKRRLVPGPIVRAAFVAATLIAMAGWLWALGEGLSWAVGSLSGL